MTKTSLLSVIPAGKDSFTLCVAPTKQNDFVRIRQILTNLLTNSIKFTSEGSVKLSVVARRENEESIDILFTVEDTGIGIDEEVRKRLFKPFSQADSSTARRFGGTGLGLTICKNVSTISLD